MAEHSVDSLAAPGTNHFTRLTYVTDRQVMRFGYHEGTTAHSVFNAKVGKLFAIRFRRFELTGRVGMYWGFVVYEPSQAPQVKEHVPGRKLVLFYPGVTGRVDPDDDEPRPPWALGIPVHPAVPLDPIDVTATISTSPGPAERGWIDFDIEHTYPARAFPSKTAAFAVEHMVRYPVLDFSGVAQELADPVRDNSVQFSAVYVKTELGAPSFNTATGIALHVENEHGHRTFSEYDRERRVLTQVLRNSIHRKGQELVRADRYVLTRDTPEAADGWGGNDVHYRLRAFRRRSAFAGGPVDWYDVADLYREWLSARYGAAGPLYTKHRPARPQNAPADTMSPHTVIMNWGLDGAVDAPAELRAMLELHPALDRLAPAGSGRMSLAQVAAELRKPFAATSPMKVETQLWGIEMAGFYQFLCGYPHLADAVYGDGTFLSAVGEIAGRKAIASVTTDPLNMLFDRKRYAGHIRWNGAAWEARIAQPFPQRVLERSCARTTLGRFNRVWLVDGATAGPAARAAAAQKMNEWGWLSADPPVIASGMYRAEQKQLCPIEDLQRLYLNQWVSPHLFAKGIRIVEFMKMGTGGYFCFRRDHQHLVPRPADTAPYDDVMGFGSWFVRRVKAIFTELHRRGADFDDDPSCSFRLSHEFEPHELLVPYVDQAYSTSELFNYVYSHLVTPMMSPGRGLGGIHPGYRERRARRDQPLVLSTYMLDPERDLDPVLPQRQPGMKNAEYTTLFPERQASFDRWRNESVAHFETNFAVAAPGLAPVAYPTGQRTTYTYSRCVQSTFNLRASIFATAQEAVRGVRIMIPSAWFEPLNDCNRPALDHAILAARLHVQYASYFRHGRNLGETRIASVNGSRLMPRLCAWFAGPRAFDDVQPLVDFIGADDKELGEVWRTRPLQDFISRSWDKQTLQTDVVIADHVEHRVWEHTGDDGVRRILYAFANLGNGEAHVVFFYGRGLEGTSQTRKRRRTIRIIGTGAAPLVGEAWAGHVEEELRIPARGFAAVVVEPL